MRRMKEDGRSKRAEPGIEGRGRNEKDEGRWEEQEGMPPYVGRGRIKKDGRGRRTGPGM